MRFEGYVASAGEESTFIKELRGKGSLLRLQRCEPWMGRSLASKSALNTLALRAGTARIYLTIL
jgi:hypothetical protein